jgi:hypothetical protein
MRRLPALAAVLSFSASALAEDPAPARPPLPPGGTLLGLSAVEPRPPSLDALAGAGPLVAETVPLAWGSVEPGAPGRDGPTYAWAVADLAVASWQQAGFEPLLVLSPESPWASLAVEHTDWVRTVESSLPAAEAAAALGSGLGVAPPRGDAWRHWERFVRDVAERYDGDGDRDVPGLLRPVRRVQVMDAAQRPSRWLGSADQYVRLLHHAGQGAKTASPTIEVVHCPVDFEGLGHDPMPDAEAFGERVAAAVRNVPAAAALERRRALAFARKTLEMPRLFDVVGHVGSGSLEEDAANLRYLRRVLDEAGGTAVRTWLTDGPARKLDAPRFDTARAPDPAERRLRSRLLAAALEDGHPEHAVAEAWLRRGNAYDLVRGLCVSRLAGADCFLCYGASDAVPSSVGEERSRAALQGLVRDEGGPEGPPRFARTPSWHAARQANRLLAGSVGTREQPLGGLGADGRAIVFSFPEGREPAWVAVLLLDPSISWAGSPEGGAPDREAAIPLPDGEYAVEETPSSAIEPAPRRVRAEGGVLRVRVTTAPLYVSPAPR